MDDLNFIETCYEPLPDEAAWGGSLAERIAPLVPSADAVMAAPYELRSDDGGQFIQVFGDVRFVDAGYAAHAREGMRAINASAERELVFRYTYGSQTPTVRPLSGLPPQSQRCVRSEMPWYNGEYLGIFATLDGQRGYQLCPGGRELVMPSRRRQAQLVRLCEHLAVGYWLRRLRDQGQPAGESAAAAVFAPDGAVLERGRTLRDARLQERLIDAVRGMDRARCRRMRHAPEESRQLWQALVAGEYALVESFERNGRRLILAIRCRTPRNALTPRESDVSKSAAKGLTNKEIADHLGMAPSTVGVHLAAALRKLRCPNRRMLSRWL